MSGRTLRSQVSCSLRRCHTDGFFETNERSTSVYKLNPPTRTGNDTQVMLYRSPVYFWGCRTCFTDRNNRLCTSSSYVTDVHPNIQSNQICTEDRGIKSNDQK